MRVLVLGATGFIGGQIARAGCEAGLDVHGLRRRADAVGAIGDLPVTWHQGDLNDPASIEAAMNGCDVLFHAAAYYPYSERDPLSAMSRAALEIRSVLAAAQRAGIRRMIYTSSLVTIGQPPAGETRLADERDRPPAGHPACAAERHARLPRRDRDLDCERNARAGPNLHDAQRHALRHVVRRIECVASIRRQLGHRVSALDQANRP